MLLKGVASRYSDALALMAEQAGGMEAVERDLELILSTVEGHRALEDHLLSPTVATAVKRSVVKGLFEKRISDTVLRFLYVLVDKGRENYLSLIHEVFRAKVQEQRNELACHVRSATSLTGVQEKELKTQLESVTGKTILLTQEVEPELLGGFVVVVGDKVIDTSFRKQLSELQERLARVE